MATFVLSPVAGANSPVDGYAGRGSVNEIFSTIRAGAGNDSSATSVTSSLYFQASSTTDQFEFMYRSFIALNLATVTGTLVSVVYSLYGESKGNGLGEPAMHIGEASLASSANVANSDYANRGTTSWGSIAYAALSTAGFNNITLNATGLAAAQAAIGGIFDISLQLSWDILNSLSGEGYAWASTAFTNLKTYSADESGTDKDPFATFTTADAGGARTPTRMTMGVGL